MHLFYKTCFFSDYHSPIGFVKNLETSASQYGHTWAEMLGNFLPGATTQVRGRFRTFIKDASLIKNGWSYSNDSLDPSGSVTKSVNPFAMNTFSYLRRADDNRRLDCGLLETPPSLGIPIQVRYGPCTAF